MSSYNSPLPVGSPEGTGAAAIAIAETAGGTNNNGNATDSAGNVKVDFVWGNHPMQPNDERAGSVTPANFSANSSGDYAWGATTRVASDRLNPALDNHANAEAEWANYPSFFEAAGNYMVTAASGNGTTVTYTSQNNLVPGDVVNITGLTASAYNLSSATVATANKLKFTVTNSANVGEITGQWYGKVESTTAASAADGAGIAYINVPSVLGNTTAVALDTLKDAGYEAANITTAAAATNVAGSITDIDRTAGSTTVELTGVGFTAAYPVGTKITVASTGTVDGTWTVTGNTSTNKIRFTSTASTVLTSGTGSIIGVAGTIKTQSVAAGTGSVATTATITITPWAAAS
jgi:hypothetical protein